MDRCAKSSRPGNVRAHSHGEGAGDAFAISRRLSDASHDGSDLVNVLMPPTSTVAFRHLQVRNPSAEDLMWISEPKRAGMWLIDAENGPAHCDAKDLKFLFF